MGTYHKDNNILGSILGSPSARKLPCTLTLSASKAGRLDISPSSGKKSLIQSRRLLKLCAVLAILKIGWLESDKSKGGRTCLHPMTCTSDNVVRLLGPMSTSTLQGNIAKRSLPATVARFFV